MGIPKSIWTILPSSLYRLRRHKKLSFQFPSWDVSINVTSGLWACFIRGSYLGTWVQLNKTAVWLKKKTAFHPGPHAKRGSLQGKRVWEDLSQKEHFPLPIPIPPVVSTTGFWKSLAQALTSLQTCSSWPPRVTVPSYYKWGSPRPQKHKVSEYWRQHVRAKELTGIYHWQCGKEPASVTAAAAASTAT